MPAEAVHLSAWTDTLTACSAPVRRLVPAALQGAARSGADKERKRAALYDEVDFPRRFQDALARSRHWVETLAVYLTDGIFDRSARAALSRELPEQVLDPGPEQE